MSLPSTPSPSTQMPQQPTPSPSTPSPSTQMPQQPTPSTQIPSTPSPSTQIPQQPTQQSTPSPQQPTPSPQQPTPSPQQPTQAPKSVTPNQQKICKLKYVTPKEFQECTNQLKDSELPSFTNPKFKKCISANYKKNPGDICCSGPPKGHQAEKYTPNLILCEPSENKSSCLERASTSENHVWCEAASVSKHKLNRMQALGVFAIVLIAVALLIKMFASANEGSQVAANVLLSFAALAIGVALIFSQTSTPKGTPPPQKGGALGGECDLTGKSDILVCNAGLVCTRDSRYRPDSTLGVCKYPPAPSPVPTTQQAKSGGDGVPNGALPQKSPFRTTSGAAVGGPPNGLARETYDARPRNSRINSYPQAVRDNFNSPPRPSDNSDDAAKIQEQYEAAHKASREISKKIAHDSQHKAFSETMQAVGIPPAPPATTGHRQVLESTKSTENKKVMTPPYHLKQQ